MSTPSSRGHFHQVCWLTVTTFQRDFTERRALLTVILDASIRTQAEQQLSQAAEANFVSFLFIYWLEQTR